jgi:PAS domain S-box-containing protein
MKQFSFFSTLRGRVVLLVFIAILPAIGLLIYYGLEGRAKVRVEASDETLRLAREKLDLYEDTIRNARQSLFTLSQIPQVREHEPESCSAIFASLLRETEAYTGLAAARPDGEVFASAPPITRPISFADRPWFQRVMQTRDFVIGKYVLGRITGRPLIVLAYPVLDHRGKITTVLSVGLDLGWVSKTLRKSELAKGMNLTLIDSNGTILIRFPDHEELDGKDMHEEFIIRTMLSRGVGTEEGVGLDGKHCLLGFTSMGKGTEAIHMGVSIPKHMAFADVRRGTVQSLILVALVAAIGLVGGWFISGLFVLSHVRRLLNMTKQLAAGDLTIRSGPPYGPGEIGQLAYHFDIMADSLERREAERDRAEEALRESEGRFRAIFEQAAVGVCQVETETGRFRMVNKKYCDIVGYTQEEMAETTLMEITHPDDLQESLDNVQRLIRGEIRDITFEKRYIRKDGSIIWVNATISAMWDVGEKPNYHIAVVQDITDHKKVEAALRESEEKYRTILRDMEEGYYEVDLAGNFLFFNDPIPEFGGYSRDEFMGTNYRGYTNGETAKEVYEVYNQVYTTGSPLKGFEWKIRRRDGTESYVEASIFLNRDSKGNPIGFRGLVRDITQRKRQEEERMQLEAQLLHAQKMEAVGRLVGGIAHDFNNLLTTIIGYTELVMMRMEKDNPLYGDLEEIKKSGERAADLIRQLMAFSRRQIIQPVVLALNRVIRDMEEMLHRLIGEDIQLVMTLGSDLWKVRVDPGQIEQVIMNLAVNARDAMPLGGRLTIETLNVDLDDGYARNHGVELTPGPYVMLAISDTGTGMDKETQSKIFEPFFTTKDKGRGTGLGLSTVYGIVKQSNGFIWVYSEPGEGTTFKIYLPRAEGTETLRKEKSPREAVGGSETILVVEDDQSVRELAANALSAYGYTLLQAGTGEEALEVLSEHEGEVHLLLTDVVLPGMSGRDLAEGLTSRSPHTRVLYMSGYADNAIVQHGVLEEGIAFIQKPFSPDSLARKVREVLDS